MLIPGARNSESDWSALAHALVARGRCVTLVDLRGHGSSSPSPDGIYDIDRFVGDLREILRSHETRPVMIGATLAGWASLLAVGEGEPDLASALVLIETSADFERDQLHEISREVERCRDQGNLSHFESGILEQIDPSSLADRLAAAAHRLRLPCLLVRGEGSGLVNKRQIETLAEMIAASEICTIENAGQLNLAASTAELSDVIADFIERWVPVQPAEYHLGSDQRTLRDATGCFATGITVITTRAPDGTPVGITANSFTSVSLDPPLLLVCPGKTVASLPAFETNPYFAINVLQVRQQSASNIFATKGVDKFAEIEWECWGHNVPILKGSLVSYECERQSMQDAGDHKILIGRVVKASYKSDLDPLLFFRGKYRRLLIA